jgi:hypothetical protein
MVPNKPPQQSFWGLGGGLRWLRLRILGAGVQCGGCGKGNIICNLTATRALSYRKDTIFTTHEVLLASLIGWGFRFSNF